MQFYKALPKLELHAHLNGSLSGDTLKELIDLKKSNGEIQDITNKSWEAVIEHGDKRTLEECFQLFGIAHSLTSTPVAVYRATQNVIKDFASDGVLYLELRSTPREVPGVMSREHYIMSIINAISESTEKDIIVKLLISIDRRQGKETAEEIMNLTLKAHQQYPQIIVGMDLSGDPSKGEVTDYFPILNKAQNAGLKISVHCAEIPNPEEVNKMIEFHPDRLGHCTCIHPTYGGSQQLWSKLLHSHIPVELCLTSNVKCGTVENYQNHQLAHFLSAGHPFTIATDDKGIFATSLSEEYALTAKYHNLNKEEIWKLSMSSIDYAFASEDEKEQLKEQFLKVKEELFKNK